MNRLHSKTNFKKCPFDSCSSCYLFCRFFSVSSSCLFYLSYYKTRRNRELKTGCYPQYHFTVMPWKELIRKVFLIWRTIMESLMIIQNIL